MGFLINNKVLLSQIIVHTGSSQRLAILKKIFSKMIELSEAGKDLQIADIVSVANFKEPTILQSKDGLAGGKFTEDTKSEIYLQESLKSAVSCPECEGLVDVKSMHYDHKTPKSQGGSNALSNVQMMHPYCNTGLKNKSDFLKEA